MFNEFKFQTSNIDPGKNSLYRNLDCSSKRCETCNAYLSTKFDHLKIVPIFGWYLNGYMGPWWQISQTKLTCQRHSSFPSSSRARARKSVAQSSSPEVVVINLYLEPPNTTDPSPRTAAA